MLARLATLARTRTVNSWAQLGQHVFTTASTPTSLELQLSRPSSPCGRARLAEIAVEVASASLAARGTGAREVAGGRITVEGNMWRLLSLTGKWSALGYKISITVSRCGGVAGE